MMLNHRYLDVVQVNFPNTPHHGRMGLITLKNTTGNVSVTFPLGEGMTVTCFYAHEHLINCGSVFNYF